jgi:hypothetical protein
MSAPSASLAANGPARYKFSGVPGQTGTPALMDDSDRLPHSIHETIVRASADYRIPSGERNAWLSFLGYSDNRYFLDDAPCRVSPRA